MKATKAEKNLIKWLEAQGGTGYLNEYTKDIANFGARLNRERVAWVMVKHGLIESKDVCMAGINRTAKMTLTDLGRQSI